MAEWGEPCSDERYTKLKNFLTGMMTGNHNISMDKAIDEWNNDLRYLEEKYGSNKNNL